MAHIGRVEEVDAAWQWGVGVVCCFSGSAAELVLEGSEGWREGEGCCASMMGAEELGWHSCCFAVESALCFSWPA